MSEGEFEQRAENPALLQYPDRAINTALGKSVKSPRLHPPARWPGQYPRPQTGLSKDDVAHITEGQREAQQSRRFPEFSFS